MKMEAGQLRQMAMDLGIKLKDGEPYDRALARVEKALASAEENAVPEMDTSQRAPLEEYTDPYTKKLAKRPTGCFGWLYNPDPKPGEVNCKKDCPYWKPCSKLSAKAPESIRNEYVEEELAATAGDMKEVVKAVREKAATKKTQAASILESDRMGLDRKAVLHINYRKSEALGADDVDTRKVLLRVLRNAEKPVNIVAPGYILAGAVARAVLKVANPDAEVDEEGIRMALDEVVPTFIEEGWFTNVGTKSKWKRISEEEE